MTDLRALLADATPRPWERDPRVVVIDDDGDPDLAFRISLEDAALIVALVNAADELVAVAEAARASGCNGKNTNLGRALAALDARLAEENK